MEIVQVLKREEENGRALQAPLPSELHAKGWVRVRELYEGGRFRGFDIHQHELGAVG